MALNFKTFQYTQKTYRNAKRIVPFNATDIFKSRINVLDLLTKISSIKVLIELGKKKNSNNKILCRHTQKKISFYTLFFKIPQISH